MSSKASKVINRVGIVAVVIGLIMVKVSGGDPAQVSSDVGGWISVGGAAVLALWELGRTVIDRIKE